MEEQKKSKVLNVAKGKAEEQKKLTYEQLNDACNQLWQQNRQLAVRNKELEQVALNKRLDYLFRVVEASDKFSSDFVVSCANEIEEALTITQEAEEPKK